MTTRRLAAILAADVVGFSSMMERDEEGTLRLLKITQRDLIEPRVREHHGRIVKTTGDGFLIEFGSPLDAVRCALEVQEAVSAGGESEEALRFRMGINLGDIIIEDDGDIFGEGVNVAARLEQIAQPGSVCISGKVFDEVEGKLPTKFDFTGEQHVKNLARPLRVYSSPRPPQAIGRENLPLPDKPSIAVLPFTNMSGDPEQEHFADGIAEDIITRAPGLDRRIPVAGFAWPHRGTETFLSPGTPGTLVPLSSSAARSVSSRTFGPGAALWGHSSFAALTYGSYSPSAYSFAARRLSK